MDKMENISKEEAILVNGGEADAYDWGRRIGYNAGKLFGLFMGAVDEVLTD